MTKGRKNLIGNKGFIFLVCQRQFLCVLKGFAPEESEDNVINTSDTLIHPSGFFERFLKREGGGKKGLSEDKKRINGLSHSNDDFVSASAGRLLSWYAGIIYTPFFDSDLERRRRRRHDQNNKRRQK